MYIREDFYKKSEFLSSIPVHYFSGHSYNVKHGRSSRNVVLLKNKIDLVL